MAQVENENWKPLTLEGLQANADRQSQIAASLLESNPALGGVTALIMAGDLAHAELINEKYQRGELKFSRAAHMIGSFARFDWVVRQLDAKKIQPSTVYKILPSLWSGSDPDDTNPRYLELWRQAWIANSRNVITDAKKSLPETVQLYRGQDRDQSLIGIAWSLSDATALKFAKGAWARQGNRDGVVLSATAKRKHVFGYITQRGEEEIIIDPKRVRLRDA